MIFSLDKTQQKLPWDDSTKYFLSLFSILYPTIPWVTIIIPLLCKNPMTIPWQIPSNPSTRNKILDHVSIFFRYIPLIFSHIPLLYHWNFHNISFFLMLQPPYFFPLKSHEIPRKNQLIKPSSGISSRYFLAIRSIKIIGKSLLTTPWFSPFHPPNIHKSIPFQPTQITLISLMTQQGLRFRRRLRSPEARLRATWNPEKTRENRKTWWKKAMKTWKFVKKTRTNT